MSVLTIRLSNDQRQRLETLAAQRGISLDVLIEAFTAHALSEFEAETRFHAMAARGDRSAGLALLDRLDGQSGS